MLWRRGICAGRVQQTLNQEDLHAFTGSAFKINIDPEKSEYPSQCRI